MKSFNRGFPKFNQKFDVHTLFTFAVFRFATGDNYMTLFEVPVNCTELHYQYGISNTVTGLDKLFMHLVSSPLLLFISDI